MALEHSLAVRSSAANAVVDSIDGGSGAGTFILLTAADAEVATLTFSDPAFGAASNGIATAASITSDTSATGNASAITKFEIRDSDATLIFEGTVTGTGGGGDIEMTNTTVANGETVNCTSFSYTAMP